MGYPERPQRGHPYLGRRDTRKQEHHPREAGGFRHPDNRQDKGHDRADGDALRDRARTGSKGIAHPQSGGGHRPRTQGAEYPYRHARPGPRYGRHRGTEQHARNRVDAFGREVRQVPGLPVPASHRSRQDDIQRDIHRRPYQNAPPARGGRHRTGQIGRSERHHRLAALQETPGRAEVRPHRPETGGAVGIRQTRPGTSSPKWRARRAPSSPTRARR